MAPNNKTNIRAKHKREGISFKKSFLLLFILFLQLTLVVIAQIYFTAVFTWIYVVSVGLSILTSLRVLIMTKNPAAKISWIMFLLIFPTFGFLIYFLAGGSDIHPIHRNKLRRIDTYANGNLQRNDISKLDPVFKENVTLLETKANATAYLSQGAKYYSSGEETFQDIIYALKQAKTSIYLEFFIVSQGSLFDEIMTVLQAKAEEGLDVRLIYDGFGSKDLMNRKLRKRLAKSRVRLVPFEPIVPIFSFFLNYRDHRKLVIIDGKTAFIGGYNLADEYVNRIERYGYWKDSGLRFEGDAVHYFTLSFLKMWMFVTGKKEALPAFENKDETPLNNNTPLLVPFVSGPYQEISVARNLYLSIISNAREEISIMTPYFIVDDALLDLLKVKVASGVKVNIIIPSIPDKRIVYSLTRAVCNDLAKFGCNIVLFQGGFIHGKNVLVDDKAAIVGSINFDYRSFYQQYENAVYLNDPAVLRALKEDFSATIKEGTKVTPVFHRKLRLFYRIYIALLKWASPLM